MWSGDERENRFRRNESETGNQSHIPKYERRARLRGERPSYRCRFDEVCAFYFSSHGFLGRDIPIQKRGPVSIHGRMITRPLSAERGTSLSLFFFFSGNPQNNWSVCMRISWGKKTKPGWICDDKRDARMTMLVKSYVCQYALLCLTRISSHQVQRKTAKQEIAIKTKACVCLPSHLSSLR